jgi:hypothetical protein
VLVSGSVGTKGAADRASPEVWTSHKPEKF